MAGNIDLQNKEWCDMVFRNRNQSYGAYDLRKGYSKNIKKSIVIGIMLFCLAVSFPLITNILFSSSKEDDHIRNVTITELMAPPPIDKVEPPPPPPPAAAPPPPVRSTIKFTPPVIKKDEEVTREDPPPVQEEIKEEISTQTVVGTDNGPPPIEEPAIGDGDAAVEDNQIFYHVEEAPEFPGGISEIGKYLGRNLKYPPMARETNVQGRVTVNFVVEKDGSVSDVKIIRGIGSGCDEEALRVVKSMPKWKPGKQNGKPVRVNFSLPIVFRLD